MARLAGLACVWTSPHNPRIESNPMETVMDYRSRITIEPGKRGGKPCIRGLRITVYDVLEMLAKGMTQAEIIEDFPELQAEDIAACLGFAANREHNLYTLNAA
jgi:uncharacterized protein (DUF433 family)